MSGLKILSSRHPRTGKSFITEAKLPTTFKGSTVEFTVAGGRVSVYVDRIWTGTTFERSVPFLTLLYHAQKWIDAQRAEG